MFKFPDKYFKTDSFEEFKTKENGVWATDPLSKSSKIYHLRFSMSEKLQLYQTFSDFSKNLNAENFVLPIPAANAKFVVWDDFIYYLAAAGKKLIKFSLRSKKQVILNLKTLKC